MCRTVGVHRGHGFTLIETMVVIAVLGIVAALAAPSFREYMQRSQLRGAANEAFTDLMFARSDAVQANASRRVTFSGTGYVISNDLAVGAAGYQALRSVTLPSGVVVSSGSNAVVTFEPVRGIATTTGTTPVELSAPASVNGVLQLSVNAVGRVALCAPSGTVKGVVAC